MTNNTENYKFRRTDLIDSIITLLSSIASTLAFMYGLYVFAFVLLSIAIGFFAKMIALKSFAFAIPTALVSFGIAVLFSYFLYAGKTLFPAILVSSFIVAGSIFAICILLKKSKSITCVAVSIGIFVILIVAFLYQYSMKTGNALSVEGLTQYIDGLINDLKTEMVAAFEPLRHYFTDLDITMEDYIGELVTPLKYMSIGIVVLLSECAALLSTVFFNLGIKISNAHVIVPNEWKIEPNKISAYVEIGVSLSYLIMNMLNLFGLVPAIVVYVFIDLLFVMTPQFCVYTVSRIFTRFKKHKGNKTPFTILLVCMILGILFVPTAVVHMLGIGGATMIIIKHRTEERMRKDEESNFKDRNDDNYY